MDMSKHWVPCGLIYKAYRIDMTITTETIQCGEGRGRRVQ